MNFIKKYPIIGVAGGQMGTISRKITIGTAYVYTVDGYKIVKEVYEKKIRFLVSGNNLEEIIIQNNSLDLNHIEKINKEFQSKQLDIILKANTNRIKKIINDDSETFNFLFNHLLTKKLKKHEAFIQVLTDFYSKDIHLPNDFNAIVKLMIEKGYQFTTIKEARQFF